jgi:hypothetical protein
MYPPSLGRQGDKYQDYNDGVYRNSLSVHYTGALKYINEIILINEDEEGNSTNDVKLSLVNILAVCNFARATDLYGAVPYTEGGWGRKDILYPAYDSQEFIYHDMMDKLKNSIAVLKTANPEDAYPGFDPLYENDLTKWIRFANSLRLRLAMRARFVDEANSNTVIRECLDEDLIENHTQDASRKYEDVDILELNNRWHNLFIVKERWKMGELFIEQLKATNDPRLPVLVEANSNDEYKGVKNGLNDLDHGNAFGMTENCYPSENLYAKDMPAYFLSADEVSFLKAEAALYEISNDDANEHYQDGIRKAMRKWDITEEQINDFLANEPIATLSGQPEEKFEQICVQAWIATVPNFPEVYSRMRRTDYPTIVQRTGNLEMGTSDGFLPKRLLYATDEVSRNGDNVANAIAIQGPNKITTPLWWDVK